ncbi:MAG: hypothetical protein NTX23_05340 [Candidatus Bipolaricaulota bacterium]|nr:hypothetical protein [Candidatus Bipolaricaulota bacterium]
MKQSVKVCSQNLASFGRWLLRALPIIANAVGVLSFVILLIGLIYVRPTLVRLHPEAIPKLSGFGAYETLSDDVVVDSARPVAWVEGFVTNDGNALASGLALEVALDESAQQRYGEAVRPATSLLIGVIGSPSTYRSDIAQTIHWADRASYTAFQLGNIDGRARLYLPPIPPQAYVQVFIALGPQDAERLTKPAVAAALAGPASLRLVQMMSPTQAMHSYGEATLGAPKVLGELQLSFRNAFLDWHGVE